MTTQTPVMIGLETPAPLSERRCDWSRPNGSRPEQAGPPITGRSQTSEPLLSDASNRPLQVRLTGPDPLLVSGLAEVVRTHPRLSVLPQPVGSCEGGGAEVVVFATEQVSAADLRSLRDGLGAPVLLVTSRLEDSDVLTVVDLGVNGVLRLDQAADRRLLVSAIAAIAAGEAVLPPRVQGTLAAQVRRIRREVLDPNGWTLSGLNSRECDVLRLLAEGLDTPEVAERLSFSERTVKYVLNHLMARCDLRSRAHAVAFAVRLGAI
ncbi:MAG: LuxR C-terminal-related transcriptional regulator [Janthinobacterium lividum]